MWKIAADNGVFDCCYLDSQRRGTTWVHNASCPGVGATGGEAGVPTSGCVKQYATGSIDRGFVSKLQMAWKEMLGRRDDWESIKNRGNP